MLITTKLTSYYMRTKQENKIQQEPIKTPLDKKNFAKRKKERENFFDKTFARVVFRSFGTYVWICLK